MIIDIANEGIGYTQIVFNIFSIVFVSAHFRDIVITSQT